ncbi:hypothetical protein AB0K40_10385 [Nonomuraea bangladeshensis]|uniref:FAD-dependent oxidoreductase n=1 Tax=Nonomuraea bangladeshensis TaxID=404385 RepID=A0ABV3H033_9ACTN
MRRPARGRPRLEGPHRHPHRPADALLIRPDAHVAWAAPLDEPAGAATPALREALSSWFGSPN